MDNAGGISIITNYISRHPPDTCDLYTLWHEIGHEAFFKAVCEANGRRIIVFHNKKYSQVCDPRALDYARKYVII